MRSVRAVAELSPLPRRPLPPEVLIRNRQGLPPVDPDNLRRDLDEFLHPSL